MRQLYENKEHLKREAKVAARIEKTFSGTLVKQELHQSHIDFLLYNRDNIPTARIEVRCRDYTWEQLDGMGGLYISKNKWEKAIHTVTEEKLAFVLVVEDSKEVLRALIIPKNGVIPKLKSRIGGRNEENMRDKWDREEVVYIKKEDFNYVKFK